MTMDPPPHARPNPGRPAPPDADPRRWDDLLVCLSDLAEPVGIAVETWLDLLEDRR